MNKVPSTHHERKVPYGFKILDAVSCYDEADFEAF